MIISVQMYSLRTDVEREGLDAVLAKVKAAGFDGVELAGTYGLTAAELKDKLDAAGLIATGAHVGWDKLTADAAACVAEAETLGYKDVICPGIWKEEMQRPGLFDDIKAVAAAMPAGFRLGYHNHAHEFEDGDFLKALYDNVPAMWFEPDTFWLKVAGKDVMGYCDSLAPRVMALHLKELSAKGKDDFNPVPGDGVTGCEAVVKLARKLDHGYIVLEAEKLASPFDEYLRLTAEFIKKTLAD